MYLAALVRRNPYVSTYFTVFVDPVGGGGSAQKCPRQKRRQKIKLSNEKKLYQPRRQCCFVSGGVLLAKIDIAPMKRITGIYI